MRALYGQISGPDTFLLSATRLGGKHGFDESGAIETFNHAAQHMFDISGNGLECLHVRTEDLGCHSRAHTGHQPVQFVIDGLREADCDSQVIRHALIELCHEFLLRIGILPLIRGLERHGHTGIVCVMDMRADLTVADIRHYMVYFRRGLEFLRDLRGGLFDLIQGHIGIHIGKAL